MAAVASFLVARSMRSVEPAVIGAFRRSEATERAGHGRRLILGAFSEGGRGPRTTHKHPACQGTGARIWRKSPGSAAVLAKTLRSPLRRAQLLRAFFERCQRPAAGVASR